MGNYKEYEDLLLKTYDEAVVFLLQKYGSVQHDYFIEKAYRRFMAGEIKTIKKGGHTRTIDGLVCHHIDENKSLNLSNLSYIKRDKIPFKYQKKDRLVYCDFIEHAILHALIAKETAGKFGAPGYIVYLVPTLEEWYLDETIPTSPWQKNCYNKSFLTPEETVNIIKKMQEKLGLPYSNTLSDYYEHKKRVARRLEQGKLAVAKEKERRREELEEPEKYKAKREKIESEIQEERRKIEEKRRAEFYRIYPNFNGTGIYSDTPRLKVIAMLYDYKYKNIYKSKKQLDLAMKPIIKAKLLDELHLVISNIEYDKR
ncbi:hypothetical protein NM897_16905 (plasmid) [Planococcus maritimus]|uniref:hypothetical protein n=1 Tax=Planococcus maritimus TaxID=192421 RepID=UPI00313A2EB9